MTAEGASCVEKEKRKGLGNGSLKVSEKCKRIFVTPKKSFSHSATAFYQLMNQYAIWLFNESVAEAEGVVPRQWKTAVITPVPKTSKPANPNDFRRISVTPILSRSLEKHIVRQYIYPALQNPPLGLDFSDQFAFRPSGSTTAALVALFHTVRTLLNQPVPVCLCILLWFQ